MHVLMTVNAAWNIWNFRKPVVQALLANGNRVTILAPPDAFVDKLTDLGCHFVPLEMNAKGLNPVDELRLWLRFRRSSSRLCAQLAPIGAVKIDRALIASSAGRLM